MSNGDTVLDNWEEIDEAEITDTLPSLQEASSVSETSISTANTSSSSSERLLNAITRSASQPPNRMKLLQRPASDIPDKAAVEVSKDSTTPSALDDMPETFQPVLMVLHKSDSSEYESANYSPATNSQTVKILRRPAQHLESRSNLDSRPKQPIKSLQQREQEYAEARLRIMGAAKNPEDDNSISSTVSASSTSNTSTTSTSSSSSINTNSNTTQTVVTPKTTPGPGPSQSNMSSLHTNQGKFKPQLNKQSPLEKQQQQQQHHQQQLQHNNSNNTIGGHLKRSVSAPKMQATGQILYNNHNPYYQALPPGHLNFYIQQQQQQQSQYQTPPVGHYNNRITAQHMKNANYGSFMPTPMHMNHMAANFNHHQLQQQQSWSPVVGGSVSSATLRQPPQHLQRQQQQQQQHLLLQQQHHLQQQHQQIQHQQTYNENILRLPRGPNGSMGFQVRR